MHWGWKHVCVSDSREAKTEMKAAEAFRKDGYTRAWNTMLATLVSLE